MVTLSADDPDVGLLVTDSQGNPVGSDLSSDLDKVVTFYGHSVYLVEVVALPGLSPTDRPGYTLDVAAAEWQDVGSYTLLGWTWVGPDGSKGYSVTDDNGDPVGPLSLDEFEQYVNTNDYLPYGCPPEIVD